MSHVNFSMQTEYKPAKRFI